MQSVIMKTPTDYARCSVQCFVDSIVPIQMQQICFCQKKVKVFATSRDISHVFTSCVELKRKIWKRLRMFIMRNTVTIWITGIQFTGTFKSHEASCPKLRCLLYISTSIWVLHTPNTVKIVIFSVFKAKS